MFLLKLGLEQNFVAFLIFCTTATIWNHLKSFAVSRELSWFSCYFFILFFVFVFLNLAVFLLFFFLFNYTFLFLCLQESQLCFLCLYGHRFLILFLSCFVNFYLFFVLMLIKIMPLVYVCMLHRTPHLFCIFEYLIHVGFTVIQNKSGYEPSSFYLNLWVSIHFVIKLISHLLGVTSQLLTTPSIFKYMFSNE